MVGIRMKPWRARLRRRRRQRRSVHTSMETIVRTSVPIGTGMAAVMKQNGRVESIFEIVWRAGPWGAYAIGCVDPRGEHQNKWAVVYTSVGNQMLALCRATRQFQSMWQDHSSYAGSIHCPPRYTGAHALLNLVPGAPKEDRTECSSCGRFWPSRRFIWAESGYAPERPVTFCSTACSHLWYCPDLPHTRRQLRELGAPHWVCKLYSCDDVFLYSSA